MKIEIALLTVQMEAGLHGEGAGGQASIKAPVKPHWGAVMHLLGIAAL